VTAVRQGTTGRIELNPVTHPFTVAVRRCPGTGSSDPAGGDVRRAAARAFVPVPAVGRPSSPRDPPGRPVGSTWIRPAVGAVEGEQPDPVEQLLVGAIGP
jgi:hypothetical protein